MKKHVFRSKGVIYTVLVLFVILVATEAFAGNVSDRPENNGKPVVKVKRAGKRIPAKQTEKYEEAVNEGKRLLREEFDYEGAIERFTEALRYAAQKEQKSDVYFYLSLAYYATIESSRQKLVETIHQLIELDYYRVLDESECPRRFIERYEEIKSEYGVLKIRSKPSGANVYLDDSRAPAGQTPLAVGHRAGSVKVLVQKGNKRKEDTLKVLAGQETASPEYVLKGKSSLLYIIGGAAVLGGAAIAVLAGGGSNGGDGGGGTGGATTGSIQVNSSPTGAQIYLDGSNTGRVTNATLTNVSPGSHAVRLVLEDYDVYEQSVSVTAGQTAQVNATLSRVPIRITSPQSSSVWKKTQQVEIQWEIGGASGISSGEQGSTSKRLAELNGISNPLKQRRALRFRLLSQAVNSRSKSQQERREMRGGRDARLGSLGEQLSMNKTGRSDTEDLRVELNNIADLSIHKVRLPVSFWGNPSKQVEKNIGLNTAERSLALSDVKIELFRGSSKVHTIVDNTENDGSYVWIVDISVAAAKNYKVRISASSDANWYGESETFEIEYPHAYAFVTKWGSFGTGNRQFRHPRGIAVDKQGYIYVADHLNDRIQKLDKNGNFVLKWDIRYSGQYGRPSQLHIDSLDYLYTAIDAYIYGAAKYTLNGNLISTWAGTYGTGKYAMMGPMGIAVNKQGDVYVADTVSHRIVKYDSNGTFIKSWGSAGEGKYRFNSPYHLAFDSKGNLYVVDRENWRIVVYDSSDTYKSEIGSVDNVDFNGLSQGIAIDSQDYLYFADGTGSMIKIDSEGNCYAKWDPPNAYKNLHVGGITVDTSGAVYVVDDNLYNCILKFRPKN